MFTKDLVSVWLNKKDGSELLDYKCLSLLIQECTEFAVNFIIN